MWLVVGDENTKFFHHVANWRCINNAIWDSLDASGNLVSDQDSIKRGVVSFFSNLYKDPKPNNIIDQLVVLKNMPSFVNKEAGLSIGSLIDILEVERSLKAFSTKAQVPTACLRSSIFISLISWVRKLWKLLKRPGCRALFQRILIRPTLFGSLKLIVHLILVNIDLLLCVIFSTSL